MKTDSSPFSPQTKSNHNDELSVTYALAKDHERIREFSGDSMWLSRKMIDDGCTLEQTLNVMEETCKGCSAISPILCVDRCSTWKVKNEVREVARLLSLEDHGRNLLNAIKNRRRLRILELLRTPRSIGLLQEELRRHGLHCSQSTIREYMIPLLKAGLVKEDEKRLSLTLYGRRIHDVVAKHDFEGQLPIHSDGYEERMLRLLMDGAKSRVELFEVVPARSLSRILKRLLNRKLVRKSSPSGGVFYFRTKRPLYLEQLSPTQRRICESLPQTGITARDLSQVVQINIRRTYKYLRSLRGKKLVFKRILPQKYALTTIGEKVAEFLTEIARIQ